MRHGRILVADLDMDFSSTNINSTSATNIGSALSDSASRMDLFNTSTDTVKVLANGNVVAKIGPQSSISIDVLTNKGQQLSLKSTFTATLSSGKISIGVYN